MENDSSLTFESISKLKLDIKELMIDICKIFIVKNTAAAVKACNEFEVSLETIIFRYHFD